MFVWYSIQNYSTSENFYIYTNHCVVFTQPVRIFYVFLPALLISVDIPSVFPLLRSETKSITITNAPLPAWQLPVPEILLDRSTSLLFLAHLSLLDSRPLCVIQMYLLYYIVLYCILCCRCGSWSTVNWVDISNRLAERLLHVDYRRHLSACHQLIYLLQVWSECSDIVIGRYQWVQL